MKNLLPLLLVPLWSCASTDEPDVLRSDVLQSDVMQDTAYEYFGAGVHSDEAIAALDVLADPEKLVGQTIRLEGEITSVCPKKGCWMRIGSEEGSILVTFKDYGFFVPKDASGRTTFIEGELAVREVPVEEARHYLEDQGKHEEALKITTPQKTVTFTATGVAIRK